jgi:hypothetical protein
MTGPSLYVGAIGPAAIGTLAPSVRFAAGELVASRGYWWRWGWVRVCQAWSTGPMPEPRGKPPRMAPMM